MTQTVACRCGALTPIEEIDAGTFVRCSGCTEAIAVPPRQDWLVASGPRGESLPVNLVIDPAQLRLLEFRRTLFTLTPRIFVSYAFIAINVFVFAWMCFKQVPVLNPTADELIAWGASYGPKTIDGQWWRLLTAMFLHAGAFHIAMNMFVLYMDGPRMERLLGNVGFAALYLVSGLCGSVASLLWNPTIAGVGASGAIFGLFGAMLGLLVRHQGSIPPELVVPLRNNGILFLVVNLIFGMQVELVDNAAHLGGFFGGLICGVLMGRKFVGEAAAKRGLGDSLVVLFGIAVVAGGAAAAREFYGDVPAAIAAIERCDEMEKQTVARLNALAARDKKGQATDAEVIDFFENQALPGWRTERLRLAAFAGLPKDLQSRIDSYVEYMKLQEETWELFVALRRDPTEENQRRYRDKDAETTAALERLYQRP